MDSSRLSVGGSSIGSRISRRDQLRLNRLSLNSELGRSPRPDGTVSSRQSTGRSISNAAVEPLSSQRLQAEDKKSAANKKSNELTELYAKINEINNKINELQTENDTYVYQIGEINKRFSRDALRLEEELEATNEAYNEMEEKLSRVQQIEDAIIKLYLEVRDRTVDVVREDDNDKKLLEEESERKALKNENPLVILDKLKASLRALLAFKEDYEAQLQQQIGQRMNEVEEKVEEMQAKIYELEEEQERLKQNEIQAIKVKNDAIESKKIIIDESNKRIAEMKAENLKLVAELKTLENQITQLHEKLDSRDQKLRDRAIEMTKIDKLDDKMLKDKNKHQFDKNRLKSEHYKSKEIYDKELNYYTKVLNEKEKMEEEIVDIKKSIELYKKETDRTRVVEMEKKHKELQEKLSVLEEELKEVNHNLKTTETKVLNLRKENIRIKQRIQKMFLAGLNDENKLRGDEVRIQQHFKETTDSQPMASHYKQLYQQKEKEVAELGKRINHMLLVEKQEAKYQKTFEEERNRLLEKLTKLKKEASNVISDDAWKTEEDLRKHNQELERRLRDYENMKSLSETQSNLFSKLAEEISGSNKAKNS